MAQLAGGVSLLLLAAGLFGPAARRRERWLLLLGALAATALLVATFSRAAWIAWWLGLVVLLLVRAPRRLIFAALATFLVAVIVAVPAPLSGPARLSR